MNSRIAFTIHREDEKSSRKSGKNVFFSGKIPEDAPAKSPDHSFCVSKKSGKGAFSVVTLRVSTLKLPLPSFFRSIKNPSVITFGRSIPETAEMRQGQALFCRDKAFFQVQVLRRMLRQRMPLGSIFFRSLTAMGMGTCVKESPQWPRTISVRPVMAAWTAFCARR